MLKIETLSNQYLDHGAFAEFLSKPSPICDGKFLFILDGFVIDLNNQPTLELILPSWISPQVLAKKCTILEPSGTAVKGNLEVSSDGNRILLPLSKSLDEIIIQIGDTQIPYRLSHIDRARAAGKNTGLLYSNGDRVDVIANWIRFHERAQSLENVFILRCEPWKSINPNFAKELEAALQDSRVEVTILQTDAPLGSDAPPMRSVWEAPDAPGKDRMTEPAHDYWRSALASGQILEIIRRRFLEDARAVMNVSPSDLVIRRTESSIFDECLNSELGYIQLFGERVYPWRVRAGEQVDFGDHATHRFDADHQNRAWVVDPKGPRADRQWNLYRVGPPLENEEPQYRFWRFMGLRHDDPNDNNPNLAPKTALVLYPELVEFLKKEFNANPVLPPEKELEIKAAPAAKSGRRCIVTTMKNEGPFLLEWIAYHRAIGFDDFIIYTNDCTDGTDRFLDLLQERGLVEHYDNPYRGTDLKPQHAALFDAQEKPTQQNADWVICMDCDEYVNIKTGDGTLDDLFKAVGDANFISLTWRLFGNSDVVEFEDRPVIAQFTECANEITRFPHQAWGVKTLYRNQGIFKKMGVHRPKGLKPEYLSSVKWVNGSGKPLPDQFIRNGWRTGLASFGYDLVQLNHYALRSMESFLVKRDRGRVNHVNRDQGLLYWFRMNHNPDHDESIMRHIPKMQAELDRLLADPDIRAQHDACVAAHRAKIEELKSLPEYLELFNAINSSQMRKLSHYLPHFGMNVFLIGPEAVPEQVLHEIDSGRRQYFNPPSAHVTGDGHS